MRPAMQVIEAPNNVRKKRLEELSTAAIAGFHADGGVLVRNRDEFAEGAVAVVEETKRRLQAEGVKFKQATDLQAVKVPVEVDPERPLQLAKTHHYRITLTVKLTLDGSKQ